MTPRRVFRALLRMLPFDFRADYGRDLEQTFEAERRAARGRAGQARVWGANLAALLAIGPREHLAQLRQDVHYGLRSMTKARAFATVAIITLALGTGVNTAIFSIVHAVLLEPLPYGSPDRLVTVMNAYGESTELGLSDPEFLDYAERSGSIDIAAMSAGFVTVTGGTGDAERVRSVGASINFLDVLRRQPALGRTFLPEEGRPGSTAVMLSEAIWRSRYGADPGILGRAIVIQGTPATVVGILPADLVLPLDLMMGGRAEVVLPATFDHAAPRHQRGGHYLLGVGRLRKDATLDAARADMARVLAPLAQQYPDQHDQPGFRITVTPLREALLGDSRPVLLVLGGAVALVLLLACANVANLMLSRGEARRRELAVRAALGASRLRMARQLLTESLLLALIGTALGLAIAEWSLDLIIGLAPAALPRLADVSLNATVLGFAATLAIVTTVLFGLIPASQISRTKADEALKEGGRSGASGGRARVRRALVVCQVALAVVLLIGAGLLLRSFAAVLDIPGGFTTDRVLTARVAVPSARYADLPAVSGFFTRLTDAVAALPGVESVGAGSGLPLAVTSGDWSFDIEGRARVDGRRPGATDWYVVTPGYFETLRIPIAGGRSLRASDTADAPPVVFINETAARSIFPGEDPVGKRIQLSQSRGYAQPWRTIAGIVRDVRQQGLDQPSRPEMFIPHTQFQHFVPDAQARSMSLVIRASGAPEALIPAVRGVLRGMDPQLPLADARAMDEVFARSVAPRRLHVTLVGTFALLAIVLAAVGLYGVIAYDVLHRTREIGIRMALGASRSSVLAAMLGRGLTLVALGAVIGLAAAALLTAWMAPLLFGVGPRDVVVFAGVAVVLFVAGALASFIPARRATRIEPLTALRD
jgi:putative ABC transport system permease protein